ncbi:hypothetical protein [Spirosoma humi]
MHNLYRHQRLTFISFFWLLTSAFSIAQTVRGRVTDATNGTSLPGVSILVTGQRLSSASTEVIIS